MVSELLDVRDFLARHPPFAVLPGPALDALPRRLTVRYLRRGSGFPPEAAGPASFYLLRKGAIELRDAAGVLVEKLAEGDSFDSAETRSRADAQVSGVTIEDTLVYVLPGSVLAELRRDHDAFDASLERSILERLRRAWQAVHRDPRSGGDLLRLEVRDLVTRAPVTAPPELPVREAASLMTRERVSALLVVGDGRLHGIVTDRDLRSRCVAAGLDGATPLRQLMTPDPQAVARSASAFEALLTMGRLRIHHLPVVDGDVLHGLVSTHDLLRAQTTNPLYLADRVGRCASIQALREVVAETRELHLQLVSGHATARQLGRAVTSVCDAVTQRLIEFATERLGPPPVPFAWVATGSQGRGELTLRSDQDNAIILDDAFEPRSHAEYFTGLARIVNQGLHQCGYVSCPGDVMASNPDWRQPAANWRRYFLDWLQHTDHKAATLAANFFDMRTVWGEDPLRRQLMDAVLPQCVGAKVFQAYVAAHALGNEPPLGFFRNFVLARSGAHEGTLDLKLHGLLPIVDLARLYALASGVAAVSTLQRLSDAATTGGLTRDGAEALQAAFEFIWSLRARNQAGQLRRSADVDNFISPTNLTAMERHHLKDAFAAIATMQRSVRTAHGGRLPL